MKRLVEYVQLVAAVTLLVQMLFHGGYCFDVLDIILWSNGSSVASGRSVKGLTIDVVNGSNTTLQAVALMNVSTFVQLSLAWYKDGTLVPAPAKFRRYVYGRNETTGALQKAYFSLPIFVVDGNKSGNYSVLLGNALNAVAVAYVVVTVGDAQRPAFTVFPKELTNCSSANFSTTGLSYAAIGFPRPVYTLRCSGMQYESQPSTLGEFVVPPDVCCLGAQCVATAYNNYHEPVDSPPTLVKELPQSSSCQQRFSDLSSRLVITLLQSRTPASSGSDLNGKIIEVISNDVNATLEAFCYQYVSAFIQLQLRWFKDGGIIDTPSMTPRVCNGSPDWGSWMSCSLRLPLFSNNGNLSGNYSVELRQANATDIVTSAWVMIAVGEVMRPSFTVVPDPMINCSSANQSMILNYVAVGFPKPVYTLRCSGVQYESEPSTSGEFIVPPEVCCLGSNCVASADNGYGSPVDSPSTIARDLSSSDSCQQHIACLSPGMEIFLKSCVSTTYSDVSNGHSIDVAADDLNATLEAVSYQKSSTFTQFPVIWLKDGRKINVSDYTPVPRCEGSEEWGSWTRCGFRLPLAALKGNLSGNYSVELRQAGVAGVLASAWVVITSRTQGLYSCSISDTTQTYPLYVSTKFPNTCTARCSCASSAPQFLKSVPSNSIVFVTFPPPVIDTTVAIGNGTLMLSYTVAGQNSILAIISVTYTLLCVNSNSNVNLAPVSSSSGVFWASAPPCGSNTSCYATVNRSTESNIDSPVTLLIGRPICPTTAVIPNNLPYFIASPSVSGFVVISAVLFTVLYCRMRKIRLLAALKGGPGNGEDLLETDGGSASLTLQSSFIKDATPHVFQRDRCVKPGFQSSARLPIVADATAPLSLSSTRRPSTLVVINARNVQLGSGNTMIVNSNPGCTVDSHAETDGCTASLASEDCDIVSDETSAQAPMNFQLELYEDCDSPVDAECYSVSLTSEGGHAASDESGARATLNCHRDVDEDCDRPVQCSSCDLSCAAVLPTVSPDLAIGVP